MQGQAINKERQAHSMEAKHKAVQADEARTNSMNWLMPHGADQVNQTNPQQLLNPVAHDHCKFEHFLDNMHGGRNI